MHRKTMMNRVFPANQKFNIAKRKPCSTAYELKIWFAKPNSHEPLGGIENELRLIKARHLFPKHHIRLIYEPANLTTFAQNKLNTFCARYKLELFSLDDLELNLHHLYRDKFLSDESFEVQLQLLEIARKECQHEFGDLAAASDIVRTLTPALYVHASTVVGEWLGTRIYTDIDEQLSAHLPDVLALEADELLKSQDNNNFLFACNLENQVLKTVRRSILKNYQVEHFPHVFRDAYGYAATTAVQHGKQGIFIWELMEEPYATLLEGTQHKLQILQEAMRAEPYPLEDLFTLRQALFTFINNSTGNEQEFWKGIYLNLIVVTSGPAVYCVTELRSVSDRMVALSDYLQLCGDLSWVPGSSHKANLEKKTKIWHEGALTITGFFKTCQKKNTGSSNTKPKQLEESIEISDCQMSFK